MKVGDLVKLRDGCTIYHTTGIYRPGAIGVVINTPPAMGELARVMFSGILPLVDCYWRELKVISEAG